MLGTCLQSADLTQVKNLTATQLNQAITDSNTVMPKKEDEEETTISEPMAPKKSMAQLRDEILEIFEQSFKGQTDEAGETKKQLATLREILEEMSADEGLHNKEVEALDKSGKKLGEALESSTRSSELALSLQQEIHGLKELTAKSISPRTKAEERKREKDAEIANLKQRLDSETANLSEVSATLKEAQKKLSAQDPDELVRLKAEIMGLKRDNANLQKNLSSTAAEPAAKISPASSRRTAPVAEAAPDNSQDEFAELSQAVKNNPRDSKALRLLAEAYVGKGRFLEAIPSLTDLVKLLPKDAETQFLLGDTYYKAEKFQESILPLSHAVRLNPKLAKAHYGLCMVNELVGNEEAASKHYRIALKLDPKIESSK